jgi:hypothetical protein
VREHRQPLVVVAEVEPLALPPLVRQGKGGRNVQLRMVRAQLERVAAGLDGVAHPPHLDGEGEGLLPKEGEPQVPVELNPQIPLADSGEDDHLSDGVRVEVMQIHPVVVRQSPHEAAR